MGHLFIVFVICSLCNEMENLKLVCIFFQILEVIIFCTLLFVQCRYDLENVVIFLLLVALLGTDFLTLCLVLRPNDSRFFFRPLSNLL